jgi:hypothetical protein
MNTKQSFSVNIQLRTLWEHYVIRRQVMTTIAAVLTFMVPVSSIFMGISNDCYGASSLSPEAKFATLNTISYQFMDKEESVPFQTSPVRVFYSFHPAVLDSEYSGLEANQIPLFFFVNGGPGCPTGNGLLSLNTAPRSVDTDDPKNVIKENQYRWSRMGHLLYVDAPNTGYSYNLAIDPTDKTLGQMEFSFRNFNPYIDAAQMVRVLLGILDDPARNLRESPVVLVGENQVLPA